MKRLVLWGLLSAGVLTNAACIKDESPPADGGTDPAACPIVTGVGQATQALRSAEAEDGREQVLVRFKPGSGADQRDVERVGGKVKRAFAHLRLYAARVTPEQREALAKDPRVESIGPDRKVYALGLGKLPPLSLMAATPTRVGSPGEVTRALKMVQAPDIWDSNADGVLDDGAPTGQGIKVCIVDSGIDLRHPELIGNYVGGRDFVDTLADGGVDLDPSDMTAGVLGGGHGTHVAGTIAAQFSQGAKVNPNDALLDPRGVIGVSPGVDLLIARALGIDGSGSASSVIDALIWCQQQGANIVTMSLGAPEEAVGEADAFRDALDAGVLSVAATGNSGTNQPLKYPAAYGSVMAVGAVQLDGGIADFSQHFPSSATQPPKAGSLVAPGTSVQSTMILGKGTAYTEEFNVAGQPLAGSGLELSPLTGYTGRLVNCGLGDSATSCGAEATCDGFVAYMDRGGGITFGDKARSAIAQGARAIIFGNNNPEDDEELAFTLGEDNPAWVPALAVTTTTAAAIKAAGFGTSATVRLAGSDYALQQGTSMATPHVSAVAALVWSGVPSLKARDVMRALQTSAKDLGTPGYDINYGYGLVQAKDALEEARRIAATSAPASAQPR